MQVESGSTPQRVAEGAMGLMQLMPATAGQYGVKNAFNPAENGPAWRISGLLDRYQNNENWRSQRITRDLARWTAQPTRALPRDAELPRYQQMATRPPRCVPRRLKVTETTADDARALPTTNRRPVRSKSWTPARA
jgi:hypothetical protein